MPRHTVWIDVEGQTSHLQESTNHEVQVPSSVDEVVNKALVLEECTKLVPAQSQLDVKPIQKSIVDVVHSITESVPIVPDRNVLV